MKPNEKHSNGLQPTTQDIANKCGVSQSTVSRALRNVKGRLSEETRSRILAVAREMGYDPMRSYAARMLVSQRHGSDTFGNLIGFFFDHEDFAQSNYFTSIFRGIMAAIVDTGFELVTSDHSARRDTTTGGLPAIYRRDEIDGVLAISDHLRIGLLELLRSEPGMAQKPIVGVVGPGNGTSTVRPDDYDAGYQAMSHLLDLGHRVTMVVRMKSPSEKSIEGFRTRGIVDACIERGLDPDTTLVDGGWTFKSEDLVSKTSKQLVEEHAKIIIQMIKERPEITAIVAPNDGDAQWIYWALRRSGIRIPEDISMVSFDDTEAILDDQGNNMLTTVRLPLFDVGEESAKLLIQRIRGEVNKDREIVLPVELIVRGSTSSPSQRA